MSFNWNLCATAKGGSLTKWVIPCMLLILIAITGCKNQSGGNSENSEEDAARKAMNDTQTNTILRQSFVGINRTINEITDETTAQVAVDKIKSLGPKIEGLNLGSLSGGARIITVPVINGFRKKLDEKLKTVYEIPGVKKILEPAVNELFKKLNTG